jgi:hypothetical protein
MIASVRRVVSIQPDIHAARVGLHSITVKHIGDIIIAYCVTCGEPSFIRVDKKAKFFP